MSLEIRPWLYWGGSLSLLFLIDLADLGPDCHCCLWFFPSAECPQRAPAPGLPDPGSAAQQWPAERQPCCEWGLGIPAGALGGWGGVIPTGKSFHDLPSTC